MTDLPGVNADAPGFPAFRSGAIEPVQTPTWNLNGLVRYERPVAALNGALALQGDFQYRSEHVFNFSGAASAVEDGYAVVNGSIAYIPEGRAWELRASVENLFDEEYLVQTFDLSGNLAEGGLLGLIQQYLGRPRMASVSFNFVF